MPVCNRAACRDVQSFRLPLNAPYSAASCPGELRYVCLVCQWDHIKAQMQCPLPQAEKPSKESKEKKPGNAYSGPHTVWDSITELSGEAAAAKGDQQIAEALTQAIQQEGGGSPEEVAAALATQEMADAASGVMAEASRLASDIISAGKLEPPGGPYSHIQRGTMGTCRPCMRSAAAFWAAFWARVWIGLRRRPLPSTTRCAAAYGLTVLIARCAV